MVRVTYYAYNEEPDHLTRRGAGSQAGRQLDRDLGVDWTVQFGLATPCRAVSRHSPPSRNDGEIRVHIYIHRVHSP